MAELHSFFSPTRLLRPARALLVLLLLGQQALAAPSDEQRNLEELRNTVVNLLQSLVERGVLTREQAEALVKSAQDKAAADVAARAAQEQQQQKEEANAVRVPYVPQIVKDEIKKEVVSELEPGVKQQVAQDIVSSGQLASVLPDWMRHMTWTGDVRVRDEGDLFAADNLPFSYDDYNQINSKGGIVKAGELAYLNTTEDRNRPRLRVRFGFDDDLGAGWSAGVRVATGAGEIFVTTNQTLGTYGQKYQVALDQGYVRWAHESSSGRQDFSATAGRFANPLLGGTDLIWYTDLTFEGIASTYRLNLSSDRAHRWDLFATAGAFPLTTYALLDPNPFGANKWLGTGQLGLDFHTQNDSRYALAAGYYDFVNTVGQRNPPGSTLYNWTAPGLFQKGNTVFDISNSTDPTVNLFALAAAYRVVHLSALADVRLWRYSMSLTADAVRNIGFNENQVSALVGSYVAPRTRGYDVSLGFGSPTLNAFGDWRASVGYRFVERDAVMDAFNDEDFHLGGTDTKGYTLIFDYAFNPHVFARAKYMAADTIDGPIPLGIDVWEIDLNTRF